MTFNDTRIFIQSGWNVIPYDSITYDNTGKKIAYPPIKWSQFLITKNDKVSNAGALICGEQLVIDCDSEESTLEILKVLGYNTLEALYTDEIKDIIGLVVKTKRGYHLFFDGDLEIPDLKGNKLDVQSTNKKLVYLPTQASEGKSVVSYNFVYDRAKKCNVIQLAPIPKKLKEYLLALSDKNEEVNAVKEIRYTKGTPLALIDKDTNLFYKRLTPSSFKEIPYYRKIIDSKGFLYPDDIKDGDGNAYLVAVAGILTADPTIDINLFWDYMYLINSKWSNPISNEDLELKVKGFVENKYPNIPFVYDSDWNKLRYSFTDIDNNEITLLYDLDTSKYLIAYLDTGKVMLKNATDISSFYANRKGEVMSANKLASTIPCIKIICNPNLPFGLTGNKEFNTFKKTKYLEILIDNSTYSQEEIEDSKNCLALAFFTHLFREQTDYFLRFLKKKLTTFRYSSTTICLFDVEGGAGKGALESFLGYFVGKDKVVRIPYATFNSKFTSDIENKLFIFLNEYPDDFKQRKDVTDKLKDITGSPVAKIEKKGLDPYEVQNIATYFVTSNRISIEVKEGDRRFLVSNCVRKFDDRFREFYFEDMVSDEELTKLAIFLKYLVGDMSNKEYMQPPLSRDKEMFLDVQESDVDKAVKAMYRRDWDYFIDLDRTLLIPEFDALNLSVLSVILNTHTRTITKIMRMSEHKFNVSIKVDTNKKISPQGGTFIIFEKGAMADVKC